MTPAQFDLIPGHLLKPSRNGGLRPAGQVAARPHGWRMTLLELETERARRRRALDE